MSAPPTHIVCYALEAWGHVRPLLHLSARAVVVTFLTSSGWYERVQTELARSFESGDEEYAKRIRVIAIGTSVSFGAADIDHSFAGAWKTLITEGELVCAQNGTRHPALPKPKAVVLDIFAIDPFDSIKALSGETVKVYTWHPGLTYALIQLCGPESMSGKGNIRLRAEERARLTGMSFEEAALEISFKPEGKVLTFPGIPPIYDYEVWAQDFDLPRDIGVKMFPRVHETIEKADGVLLFTPESYEPEAVAAVRRWFKETNRPVYACGPLLPSASKGAAVANETKLSKESVEIQSFLDEVLRTSGERSLVYISFGSLFWPAKSPENVWAVVDVLIELNVPFILSHASPMAVITDENKEKVAAYGKGLLSPWTPQQLILDHSATGWFVAHGGHNGVTEAISAGVPLILWPFGGDQEFNALLISETLQIGYELLEVRTGNGLKPIYRTGYVPKGTVDAVKAEARDVFKKAFGEDGAKKRARLEAVRKGVRGEWEEGGASLRDVSAFLDSL
ncbi:UDP-Glycosyltransferase/glycogen phosphorylase [Earliella scabrosa]|nr:UDP-Glycosyltransferase/glycogen phosphorylase [Earliella scabrosa]